LSEYYALIWSRARRNTDLFTGKKLYGTLALSIVTTVILWKIGVRSWDLTLKIIAGTVAVYVGFAVLDLFRKFFREPATLYAELQTRIRQLQDELTGPDQFLSQQVDEAVMLMSAPAIEIVKRLLLHGGEMRHQDLGKDLMASVGSTAFAQAIAECRESTLVTYKLPDPIQQYQTWAVSPTFRPILEKKFFKPVQKGAK
jgi:hypothetical protein